MTYATGKAPSTGLLQPFIEKRLSTAFRCVYFNARVTKAYAIPDEIPHQGRFPFGKECL
jgi:hypothetical protein